MREGMESGSWSHGLLMRGGRRSPARDRDLDDPREDREWQSFNEPDERSRRGEARPRKRGGHGCDRIRGRGTRRQID